MYFSLKIGITFFIVFIYSSKCISQESLTLIKDEYLTVEKLHNDRVFFQVLSEQNKPFSKVEFNVIDSGYINGLKYKLSVISLELEFIYQKRIKLENKQLKYYLLSYSGEDYKLFGFYGTDIKFLLKKHIDVEYSHIYSIITKNNLLSSRYGRRYIRDLKSNRKIMRYNPLSKMGM